MKPAHICPGSISLLPILLLCLLLNGCASVWTRIDTSNTTYQGAHYRLSLPLDWVRIAAGETLVVTRDGPAIQMITASFSPHAKAFERLGTDSSASLLPSELAELYIAEFRAQDANGLPSLEVLRNEPAQIAGQPGFSLHLRYTVETGLQYEALVTGFANTDGFFLLRYIAPSLHFFERDRETFQTTLGGFQAI